MGSVLRTVKVASIAALWLVPMLVLVSAFSSDWIASWKAIGVPAMLPRFADLSTIPEGLETQRQGQDPLVTNPHDALNRPVNYPRVWLYLFSALRIDVHNVWLIAIPFCACYLTCMSVLIGQAKHPADAVILLLASLSTAPLLAMERGNNDLFVFSLVFLGCCATHRYVKSAALAAASLLKVFPFAGMIVDAVRRPSKQRIVPLLLCAFVLALLAWQWRDIDLIRHGTPATRIGSYGVLSLQEEIAHFFPDAVIDLIRVGWIATGACWLVALATADLAWKHSLGLDPEIFNSPQGEMCAVFGAMYVLTYAIGSNWDYRLITLLPTIPFALQLMRTSRFRDWAVTYLVLLGIAENALRLEGHGGTLLGHMATFPLFLLVLAVLTCQVKGVVSTEVAWRPSAVPAGSSSLSADHAR